MLSSTPPFLAPHLSAAVAVQARQRSFVGSWDAVDVWDSRERYVCYVMLCYVMTHRHTVDLDTQLRGQRSRCARCCGFTVVTASVSFAHMRGLSLMFLPAALAVVEVKCQIFDVRSLPEHHILCPICHAHRRGAQFSLAQETMVCDNEKGRLARAEIRTCSG